ncbi:MAG: GNAT family N-acetyltransferase [Candidatus Anammoxibacter sp.]
MPGEKIGFWDRTKNKLRYSSFLRLILDGIAKTGIRIFPYYIVLEGLTNTGMPHLESGFDEYELCFLSPQDMKAISFIPGRNFTEEYLLQRLQNGQKCFGVKYRGEIAAFTWCNFDWCTSNWYKFPLEDNEAYLFDAYTLMSFRGKGLAPYIRYQCYKELVKFGRDKLYSISECVNTPSIKVKKKLNAKFHELRLSIELFKKWSFDLHLKKYR